MVQEEFQLTESDKRTLISNGLQVARIRAFAKMVNKIPIEEEALFYINVKVEPYRIIGLRVLKDNKIIPIDENSYLKDFKITGEELKYIEEYFLKDEFSFFGTKFANILLLEMKRK